MLALTPIHFLFVAFGVQSYRGILWSWKRARRNSAFSLQSLAGKGWEHEGCLVDLLAVVSAQLLLLLDGPAAEGLLEVAVGILAAHHEADLAGGVGGDGGVAVFDVREDLLASLLEVGDEWHVEPLVLS